MICDLRRLLEMSSAETQIFKPASDSLAFFLLQLQSIDQLEGKVFETNEKVPYRIDR